MPPIETREGLSIPEDARGNDSNNSNSPNFEPSETSSSSSISSRNSASPEESALLRMFQEHSINIPNLNNFQIFSANRRQIVTSREQTLLDLLRHASNGDDLSTMNEVRLRLVASTMSLSQIGLYCPRLRILRLDDSSLTSLRDIGTTLRYLKVLHVSKCGLTSLDGTFGLSTLQELYGADNHINHLGPCAALQNLKVFNIERNQITNLNTISFLSICPKLVELSVLGNPICKHESYSMRIVEMLSNLRILDGKSLLKDKCEFVETDDTKSETESLSFSMDISSLTEPNSDENEEIIDPFEFQSNQDIKIRYDGVEGHLKNNMKQRRPATSSGIGFRRAISRAAEIPTRPLSANVWMQQKYICQRFPSDDDLGTTPSALTSGSVVYGNIGRALARSRSVTKKFTEIMAQIDRDDNCWNKENFQKNQKFLFCSLPTSMKNKTETESKRQTFENVKKILNEPLPQKPTETAPVVELEFGVTGMIQNTAVDTLSSSSEALEAAKMWRNAFALYRTQNNINLLPNINTDAPLEEVTILDPSTSLLARNVLDAVPGSKHIMHLCESEPD